MKDETISLIQKLTPAKSVVIKGKSNREDILRTAKILKKMGKIKFDVVSRERDGQYVVAAI